MKGIKCITNKEWWIAALTRALKTVAQVGLGALATDTIWGVDWKAVGGIVVMAGLLSLLTSLAGIPEINESEANNG
ncbi:MAG: holin [Oscillospiraceae bacterium]|jgi:hypothetical protein|nr:holin [Oscillospiraceae bacterium]